MGLGNAIRSLRKKQGMTQGDLAQATGFSLDSISRWEREERSPVADDLRKIALVLNTTVGVLMGEEPNSQSLPVVENPKRRSQALLDLEQMIKDLAHENPDVGGLLRTTVENWEDLGEEDIKFISDTLSIALGRISNELKARIKRESKDGRL